MSRFAFGAKCGIGQRFQAIFASQLFQSDHCFGIGEIFFPTFFEQFPEGFLHFRIGPEFIF